MATTEFRNYPLPSEADSIRAEFLKLMLQVLPMIDTDIGALLASLAGKAAVGHPHEISDVEGLATALAGKMAADKALKLAELVDVEGMAEALEGYVPVKVGSKVLFQAAAAALGLHYHPITQITGLEDALALKLDASRLWTGTQAEYDAIVEKASTTLYIIT